MNRRQTAEWRNGWMPQTVLRIKCSRLSSSREPPVILSWRNPLFSSTIASTCSESEGLYSNCRCFIVPQSDREKAGPLFKCFETPQVCLATRISRPRGVVRNRPADSAADSVDKSPHLPVIPCFQNQVFLEDRH